MDVEAFKSRLIKRDDGLLEFPATAEEIRDMRDNTLNGYWLECQRAARDWKNGVVLMHGILITAAAAAEPLAELEREGAILLIVDKLKGHA